MTDQDIVRRLSRRPKTGLIAVTTVAAALGAIVFLLGPIANLPSASETLPKVFERKAPPPPDPGSAESGMPAIELSLPEGLLPGVKAVASQTVIVVVTPTDGTEGSRGNGVLVRDGVVLTAAHLHTAAMSDALVEVYCDGKVVAGRIRKQAEIRDLSLIIADGCHGERVRVSRERLRASDRLYVSGFTFSSGLDRKSAKREVSVTAYVPGAQPQLDELEPEAAQLVRAMRKNGLPHLKAVHGTMVPGQSGSPVTLASGELVGIWILNYPRKTQSYMVPASSIARILMDAGYDP